MQFMIVWLASGFTIAMVLVVYESAKPGGSVVSSQKAIIVFSVVFALLIALGMAGINGGMRNPLNFR